MKSLIKFILELLILAPLALVYNIVTRIRNLGFDWRLFKLYKSALPVISVGNITVGGTGKTPLVAWLVKELLARGKRPVILSRGYGGSITGPHLVSQKDSYKVVGDEPLMLFNSLKVPVVVAKKRVQGAEFIESQELGNIIILDDGFQHRWLMRDLDIVCVNVAQKKNRQQFIEARLMPWGIFRESKKQALKRAQLIVLSFRSQVNEVVFDEINRELKLNNPVVYSTIKNVNIKNFEEQSLAPQSVCALCAIANPEGFFQSLKTLGFKLEQQNELPDHSPLLEDLCKKLLSSTTLPIVITEKDWIKLDYSLRSNPRIYTCRFELELFGNDKLGQELDRILKH